MHHTKCCEEKHDLLLIGEEAKRHYVVIKDFNTFMYNHTVYRGRKQFLLLLFTSFQDRRNIAASD